MQRVTEALEEEGGARRWRRRKAGDSLLRKLADTLGPQPSHGWGGLIEHQPHGTPPVPLLHQISMPQSKMQRERGHGKRCSGNGAWGGER